MITKNMRKPPYGALTEEDVLKIYNTPTKVYWVTKELGGKLRIESGRAETLYLKGWYIFTNYWHAWAESLKVTNIGYQQHVDFDIPQSDWRRGNNVD